MAGPGWKPPKRTESPDHAAEPTLCPELIRESLERVLASEYFRHSDRLSKFLRYAVEETLKGRLE